MNTTELPLVEFLNSPRPEIQKNWKGDNVRPDYPKGQTIARCGDVFLIQTSANRFATVYGLEINMGMDRWTAAAGFGQACIHQAECHGITC